MKYGCASDYAMSQGVARGKSYYEETEEFKTLYSEMDKYSVEEIEVKAKVILADSYAATFAAKPETKPNKVNLSLKDENESPYGNLF